MVQEKVGLLRRVCVQVENAGNKTKAAVSETRTPDLSYLQGEGTLLGLDTCAPKTILGSVGSMSHTQQEGHRLERRRSPRYRYHIPVEIEWGSARLRARTRDVSAGGMFLESEDVLWVGAGFRAHLAAERPLWIECSVKRVEPGTGMGVAVELREDLSQRHYAELLEKLATEK